MKGGSRVLIISCSGTVCSVVHSGCASSKACVVEACAWAETQQSAGAAGRLGVCCVNPSAEGRLGVCCASERRELAGAAREACVPPLALSVAVGAAWILRRAVRVAPSSGGAL